MMMLVVALFALLILAGAVVDLTADLAGLVLGRVHVRVRIACADGADELVELTRLDPLARRTDDIPGYDRPLHRARRRRTRGLRTATTEERGHAASRSP